MRLTYHPLALLTYTSMTVAIQWIEPVETPMGLMITGGFSPLPTEAPGFVGIPSIPKELRRRQDFPVNWCGFIDGTIGRVLSCEGTTNTKCVSFGTAVGCCGEGTIATCSNLYTSCIDTASLCDDACSSDTSILKCTGTQQNSYCATWAIANQYTKYDCNSDSSFSTSVALIPEYFATVFNADLPLGSAITGLPITKRAMTPTSASRRFTISIEPSSIIKASEGSGVVITGGVIAGIAAGGILFWVIFGVLIFIYCRRKRRRQRANAVQLPVVPPTTQPMNQPYQGPSQPQNTSQPYPISANHLSGSYFPAPPPQYTTPAITGYYVDPKNASPEVQATLVQGSEHPYVPGYQQQQQQQAPSDPTQRAETTMPISASIPQSASVSLSPPPPSQTQDYWTGHQQQQQHHNQQQQYQGSGPVYEMGTGGR